MVKEKEAPGIWEGVGGMEEARGGGRRNNKIIF